VQLLQLAEQAPVAATERLLPDVDQGAFTSSTQRATILASRARAGLPRSVLRRAQRRPPRLRAGCTRAARDRLAWPASAPPYRAVRPAAAPFRRRTRRCGQANLGSGRYRPAGIVPCRLDAGPDAEQRSSTRACWEVLVQRRDVDAGGLRDRVRVDALETEFVEEPRGGVEDVIEGHLPRDCRGARRRSSSCRACGMCASWRRAPSARRPSLSLVRLRSHVPLLPLLVTEVHARQPSDRSERSPGRRRCLLRYSAIL